MTLKEIKSIEVRAVFWSFPPEIRSKLLAMRKLIFNTAHTIPDISQVEETLKWGEPAYLNRQGSTIRIAWKKNKPEHYALYFNCRTSLVDTFRKLYQDDLKFEDNRAVLFHKDSYIPVKIVTDCISMALRYHSIKNLPLLGAKAN